MRRIFFVAFLILAACSGDGEATTTTTALPVLTTLGAAEPQTTSPPTTTAPATSTTTSTTTTTAEPPNAAPKFGLTQVVFGDSALVIVTNWGNAVGNLDGYWLSQGLLHEPLPDIELSPGEQALLGLARVPPPELSGMAATVFLGQAIGELDPSSGEVALHANSAFTDAASMVAYVEWGEPGHGLAETAIAAGLWTTDAVAVMDDAPSISSGVFPAAGSDTWFADIGG